MCAHSEHFNQPFMFSNHNLFTFFISYCIWFCTFNLFDSLRLFLFYYQTKNHHVFGIKFKNSLAHINRNFIVSKSHDLCFRLYYNLLFVHCFSRINMMWFELSLKSLSFELCSDNIYDLRNFHFNSKHRPLTQTKNHTLFLRARIESTEKSSVATGKLRKMYGVSTINSKNESQLNGSVKRLNLIK